MQQLSAQDAQFLYMETNKSLSQVTAVAIYDPSTAPDGIVRFKQIIEHVKSRLHTSPIYRRRLYHVPLELDYPYWINDEHFDIEYHIRHGRLPHPADWRQLCIHLARFHSRPLDMQRPPWEMYVIEGLDNVKGYPKGCYAIATKLHHAAADGMAIVNFFGGLMDIDQQGTPVMPVDETVTSQKFERPTSAQMAVRGFLSNIKSPVKVADSLLRSAPAIVQTVASQLKETREEGKRSVPMTRFNLETSPHRVFDSTSFELSQLKQIKALSEGSTINDVVLSICSGALRKYLVHHKELPAESLKAFVPVNTRPKKKSLYTDETPGNNITTMSPALHTDIADPVDRYKAIHKETKQQKAAKRGLSARIMTDVSKHIPASTQLMAARMLMNSDAAAMATNVCISNVPGPDIPVYMNGAKVVGQLGLGPLADRMGLFIAVGSYNNVLAINPTSCRRTMPDIGFFIDCIRDSFDELYQAAMALPKQGTKSKTKSVRKKVAAKVANKVKKKVANRRSKKVKKQVVEKVKTSAKAKVSSAVVNPTKKRRRKKSSATKVSARSAQE